MRYGILSDVHGNLEALNSALAFLGQQSVDRYAFLGDAVGYGPNPNEVCDRLREVAHISVMGNHDAAASHDGDTSGYHRAARQALDWCRLQLSSTNRSWLASLPYSLREGDLGLSHGSPFSPESFDYLFDVTQFEGIDPRAFETLPAVNLMGHSHLTVSFQLSAGGVEQLVADVIAVPEGHRLIATVGSVGQPRDRNPNLCCAVYDSESRRLSYHRLDYDKETTRQKIVAAGLPAMFGDRLFLGV